MTERKYPIGIQTFSRIIREGYLYVDKTDLVWELQHFAKFVFLSRPRRFGKSLLSSTLESYYLGEKELFNGLKIMKYENDWDNYPVIHLDLSMGKGQANAEELRSTLLWLLQPLADIYGKKEYETSPGKLLTGIITRAQQQTGRQAVIIIDEYDAPLLEVLHKKDVLEDMRNVMQEFYLPLKSNERNIKFCFITGITKFSQLSIFSTINNLKNVSMNPRFSAICGITEQEVRTVFKKEIIQMSKEYNCSSGDMFQKIKDMYDGYHFSAKSEDIYNPYSLLNAFADNKLTSEWFATGTPSFLIEQLKRFHTDITSLEKLEVMSTAFDRPTEDMEDALPLLYQAGYLTIKDYDRLSDVYTLSFPNNEVRTGYARGLIPAYLGLQLKDTQGFAIRFWRALNDGDANKAMLEMQAYLASLPYVEGFKKKLENVATAEGFYEYTFYLLFTSFNDLVRTQVKSSKGRTDLIVFMPDTIYIMELKVNDTAQSALEQINKRGYAIPYQTDGRKIIKIGIKFDTETRTIDQWQIES
jgi:hypothetical protein